MKKLNFPCFALLLFAFYAISCTATGEPSPKAESTSTISDVFSETPTPILTSLPSIPVIELPNKHSDAVQWKNKLKGIAGEFYLYDGGDISPDGRWFVSVNDSTFLLRLIPLDSLSPTIEYQIDPGDTREIWVFSWSPDSSAFVVCVNYTHNPNGCQAIKIFEVSPEGILKEHNVAWAGKGFHVLWYGGSPTFVSPYSGIFKFDRNGNMFNHSHLLITDSMWVKEGRRDVILAIERPYDTTTLDFLPSKIFELDGLTLESSEIYESELPLSLVGSDMGKKYFLFEEISPERGQSLSVDLWELETRTIIQRYVFPLDTKIFMSASGNNQVAFNVRTKGDDKEQIWVFNFSTRRIEIRGTGLLMGWLYPDEGFLVRDESDNWTLLSP